MSGNKRRSAFGLMITITPLCHERLFFRFRIGRFRGEPAALRVQIAAVPETIRAGEPVRIEAKLTLNGKPVDDAKQVEFELWKEGRLLHDKIKATRQGEGIYGAENVFDEEGTYYVIAHARAKGMHSMPKKKLTVGGRQ
ncbi:FixH family protein [Paenibacillus sp. P25]|nr:FixH family protein [Paenibacillus sp. P25]